MNKILIPIDGSEYSMRAVEKGKEYAAAFDCRIVLIHVSNIIFPLTPDEALAYIDYQKLEKDVRKEAEDLFMEAKTLLGEMVSRTDTLFITGDPANKIIEYLKSNDDIDLVIMGSHGQGSLFHRILIGSVTNKVLHTVKQPILVIK